MRRPDGGESVQRVVIAPRSGWQRVSLSELWNHRELLWTLAIRDVRVRYKQTFLGVAWVLVQPLMNMAVFAVLLGRVAKLPSEGFPYPVFVYAGLLSWTYFATAMSNAALSVVGSAHLISKVYFPRVVVPFSAGLAGLLDFAISAAMLLALMLYYGIPWTLSLLWVPLLLTILIAAALGTGTLLAAITVEFRDIRWVVPFLTQIWMFVTPVVYSTEIVPPAWRWLYFANPLVGVTEGMRSSFLGRPMVFAQIASSAGMSLALLVVGVLYFARVERKFADVI